jgi:hypothetical protein
MEETLGCWEVKAIPGGRISLTVTYLDGSAFAVFFNKDEWEELKRCGDLEIDISVVALKHNLHQEE